MDCWLLLRHRCGDVADTGPAYRKENRTTADIMSFERDAGRYTHSRLLLVLGGRMRSLSADNGISRRTVLTRLGASALGLAFMNSSRFAPETKHETLRSRLPEFSERSRA